MSTTNPVFSVLATSGNQAPLAAGARVDTLAIGQIGVFNYQTGLSIDGTVPADARDIFLAVGLPNSTGSALGDIRKSAGQVLQVRNTRAYNFKGYVDTLPKIIDIAGYTAKCETNYILHFELRNGLNMIRNGYNGLYKSFSYTTSCCADNCAPCGDGDCNELSQNMLAQINADKDALMTASYIANVIGATVTAGASATASMTVTVGTTAYTVPVTSGNTAAQVAAAIVTAINTATNSPYRASAVGAVLSIYPKTTSNTPTGTFALTSANGTGVTVGSITANAKVAVADLTAFVTANPGVCVGIRVTTNPLGIKNYCNVNLGYVKIRETDVIAVLKDGFACNGTVATVQQLQVAEGKGYDLRESELFAIGYDGSPYRQSDLLGVAREVSAPLTVVVNSNYNVINLGYDQQSVGGWLEYLNNLRTDIAIPCADSTTLNGLVTILDLIFTQFGAMANDVAANGDCTNTRTGLLAVGTDGIEMVSS